MDAIKKELKNFSLVQVLILFNLVLAGVSFMKDIVLASYFGTSDIADAINLAFFLPDTLGNNLIGAAIAVSSIPVLTRLSLNTNPALYHETIRKIAILAIPGTLFVLTASLFLFKPLLQLFPLATHENVTIIHDYFLIMSPLICCAPLWLLGSSVLQSSRKFIVPAITPILFNLVLLVTLLWCQWKGIPQTVGGNAYSYATTFGTLLCVIFTWNFIQRKQKRSFFSHPFKLNSGSSEINKVLLIFSSYACILLFTQAGLLAERFFASSLETGAIAALTYAYRLSQFPLWVFIAAITTFILPIISYHLETNNLASLKRDLVKSLVLVIGCSGIISLLFVLFSEQVIKLLFLRGSFTMDSVKLTSIILKGYGLSIMGQSLYVFCTRYYIAQGEMKAPLLIGLAGCCLNIALLGVLVPMLGAGGLGYAIAISSTVSGMLLLAHFIKHLKSIGKKGETSIE